MFLAAMLNSKNNVWLYKEQFLVRAYKKMCRSIRNHKVVIQDIICFSS